MEDNKLRLGKFISMCGFASRRKAEELIINGEVSVDDEIIKEVGRKILPTQLVKINGQILYLPDEVTLYMLYKPAGLIVSRNDEEGKKTIFDILPNHLKNLITIGRLDKNSEGLLLLTNNGELARRLTLPIYKIERKYNVRVFGKIPKNMFEELMRGIKINNILYKQIEAKLITSSQNNHWLEFILIEGKNREIRNICEYYELKISKLIRIKFGIFELGNLQKGKIIKISKNIMANLDKFI